jgi:hypothetical protein
MVQWSACYSIYPKEEKMKDESFALITAATKELR